MIQAPTQPLADVPLADLRAYRKSLRDEEASVSYWRRVLHGRIDLLAKFGNQPAGAHTDWLVGADQLAAALKDTATGHSRQALMRITAPEDLPELPGLNELWARYADPNNPEDVAAVLAALTVAAHQVTEYRGQIHKRIDAANIELVTRYTTDPDACLDLLG